MLKYKDLYHIANHKFNHIFNNHKKLEIKNYHPYNLLSNIYIIIIIKITTYHKYSLINQLIIVNKNKIIILNQNKTIILNKNNKLIIII